ncbi:MAG: tyrosine-protein phosphatase [Gaiellaceae bacterium]
MRTATDAKAPAAPDRILRWDGCVNVRDLGGLPLTGGGETRFGVCVRADTIRGLTAAGWDAVAEYGVRLAVDLRGNPELAEDPPEGVPIEVRHFPVNGDEVEAVREWRTMEEAYRGLLGRFGAEFAGAVTTVARADGPVVIHCFGGRDRTGLACGLMLRLAGVPLDAIATDHGLSDANLAPHTERWVAAPGEEGEVERRRRVTAPAGEKMAEVLADVDPRAYLLSGGAKEEDLDRLVVRLRG